MSAIDTAITRLQALAQQTSVTVRHAPAYPVDDASVLPMAIAHLASGRMLGGDATANIQVHNIGVDFHVNRQSLRQAYAELDTIVPEYIDLLAGDPTLAGAVDTIQIDNVIYNIAPAQWDRVTTLCAFFTVPVKIFSAPSTSS